MKRLSPQQGKDNNATLSSAGVVGFGCMNLSHAYGQPLETREAVKLIERALDLGVRHFDTAALYGFGRNEALLGGVLKSRRAEILLNSKCGMTGVDGVRVIDGRPETLIRTCDESLSRLQTDFINIYYLHRWDKFVPIEESISALSGLVSAGKIGAIGLSEVCADTIKRAHKVYPIAAVQSEYSLWSRNPEIAVLDICKKLGIGFVAFSPLGRGIFADEELSPQGFVKTDIRRNMPRFQPECFMSNRNLVLQLHTCAKDVGCTMAQLALAWVLHQGEHICVIPGTRDLTHLEENLKSAYVKLDADILQKLSAIFTPKNIHGERYGAKTQLEIDTENF